MEGEMNSACGSNVLPPSGSPAPDDRGAQIAPVVGSKPSELPGSPNPVIATALLMRGYETVGGMADTTPIQCPSCGWTGDHADLRLETDGAACPNCEQTIRE